MPQLDFTLLDVVLTAALLLSLAGSLVLVPLLRFRLRRGYGLYLYALYVAFLVAVVLVATGVVSDPGL